VNVRRRTSVASDFRQTESTLSFLQDEGLVKRAGMNEVLLTIGGIRACENEEDRQGAEALEFDSTNVVEPPSTGEESSRFNDLVRRGTGRQGSVYAAFDTRMGRRVALKFLHDDPTESGVLIQARAMAPVLHPNVVTIFQDVSMRHPLGNDTVAALVMELVDGEELGERFGRPISIDDARTLGRGILAGIGAFHERQRFHGDLHTEQVLVDKQGVPKIIDAPRSKSFAALSTTSLSRMQEKDCRDVRWLLIEILERVDLLRANVYRSAVNDNPPNLEKLRHEFEATLADDSKDAVVDGNSAGRRQAGAMRADVAGEVLHAALRFATDLGSVVSTEVRSAEDVSDGQDPDARFRKRSPSDGTRCAKRPMRL
jgi:serine/threonine protein kinase